MEVFRLLSRVVAIVFSLLLKQQLATNALLLDALQRRRREEEAFIVSAVQCLPALPMPPPKTKKLWMKIRSKDWWERVVLLEFTDLEWKQNFRMTRSSFTKLCGLAEGFMAPDEVTIRAPIPCMMRVAIVLYRLGSCAEYRLVSNQFGIHKSTVKKFTYMFCQGMLKGPIKELIQMPNEEEASEIATRFEAAHFIPQIMGLIDGTHIPILPPSDGFKDFVNRKGWTSYVLQAVVDDRCWYIIILIHCTSFPTA
ncbi:uncharacterized protein LOC127630384 isoform X2 [Xyrichtys novacula]|uniref:Uncharacterized protein LOC127630384 isoform X2 n=1 Tax=Xyrichtys novacula TaxID=13765 RepID=A0AAV1GC79_XYRNO|nr:uncharacterized protein LOC127630384 isoform X2 [Xyrichtys novacula]